MAGNRFEIVSSGFLLEQTAGLLNPDATLTIVDIDVLSNGYRLEWREDWTIGIIPFSEHYRQEFNLNGTALTNPEQFTFGSGSLSATSNGLTYTVTEGPEGSESQAFTVRAEITPSGTQGTFNVYTDPGGSSTLDGTSNTEIVELGGGNDTYYSSDDNSTDDGGEDTVFGGGGDDEAHLRNRDPVTNEERFAGHFDGGAGNGDELFVNDDEDSYRIISHGDTLVFRHQDFQDRSNLGRKIATAENIERFEGEDLTTLPVEDGFDIRATNPTGPAPSNISAIRDFDGNDLGAGNDWRLLGAVDTQYDNDAEWIYVNSTLGRWASVGPGDNGGINFGNHGQGGDTRVVGIYIDPTLAGEPDKIGGPFDSQARFQEDLRSDTLELVTGFDFDADGFQEIYFRETNGDAYLRALMHADGNIQYANYQSEQQVRDYLTDHGYDSQVIDTIIG